MFVWFVRLPRHRAVICLLALFVCLRSPLLKFGSTLVFVAFFFFFSCLGWSSSTCSAGSAFIVSGQQRHLPYGLLSRVGLDASSKSMGRTFREMAEGLLGRLDAGASPAQRTPILAARGLPNVPFREEGTGLCGVSGTEKAMREQCLPLAVILSKSQVVTGKYMVVFHPSIFCVFFLVCFSFMLCVEQRR